MTLKQLMREETKKCGLFDGITENDMDHAEMFADACTPKKEAQAHLERQLTEEEIVKFREWMRPLLLFAGLFPNEFKAHVEKEHGVKSSNAPNSNN